MNKIYILSTTRTATGGTELLQQLCSSLRKINRSAFMVYMGEYNNSPVEKRFSVYNNPIAESIADEKENIVIFSETSIDQIYSYKKVKKIIWWLSVDNYYGARKIKCDFLHELVYRLKDMRNSLAFKKCNHLVQSEYARQYLINEKKIDNCLIDYLSDYLNRTFLDEAQKSNGEIRNNVILYNPKKGIEFTRKLMKEIPEYKWIALQNLTPVQMRELMKKSKVYVDFGNHPGKDRIPREAAICGCCVLTGKRGAAANEMDVKIPEFYKFNDSEYEIEQIHKMVKKCMDKFDEQKKDFEHYISVINAEEAQFNMDVRRIFGKE